MGNVSPPGVTDQANAGMPSSGDPYRDMLERGSQMSYTGPTNLSTDPRYGQVGTDVRNAQRELDATGSEAGLAAASGGTYADAALMNQQGQRAFANTRDKFGNLNKFAGQVDANAAAQGDQAQREAQGRALNYKDQLGQYDAAQKAKTDAANAPKEPGAESFDDMVKNNTHKSTVDERGHRIASKNATAFSTWQGNEIGGPGKEAYDDAAGLMKNLNIPGLDGSDAPEGKGSPAQSAYWDKFMGSLPEDMRLYVEGMTHLTDPIGGAMKNENSTANSDADWQWFYNLFKTYAQSHPPGGK